jgi:subtilisin family serine protease
MRPKRAIAAIAGLAALAAAQPAAARAPIAQLRDVRAGTAIVQYDGQQTSARTIARAARNAGASRTVRYRVLPFVTVRGPAAALRRIGSLRNVRAIHMNRNLSYFLHESVPLAYGGSDPHPTWSAGFDGRGVNVAVVDSGIDGLHSDLQSPSSRTSRCCSTRSCNARARATATRPVVTARTSPGSSPATAAHLTATTPAWLRVRGSSASRQAR